MKKAVAVLVCSFVLAVGMAIPAMAATGDGYYVVGSLSNDTTGSINVKVVLESRAGTSTSTGVTNAYDVVVGPMTDGYPGYSVRDAMMSLASVTANNVTLYDVHGNVFESTGPGDDVEDDTYIDSIKIGSVTFEPELPFKGYSLDGWMFRVNGKIPLIGTTGDPASGGPYGQDIASTPISSGDIIHFHWDYQYQETASTYYSTNFQTVAPTVSGNTLSVMVKKSWSYFDNSNWWHIDPFDVLQNDNTYLPNLGADGTYAYSIYALGNPTALLSGSTTVTNGLASISLGNLASGTYYLHMIPDDSFHYKFTLDYNTWLYIYVLDNASVFEAFSIPSNNSLSFA